MNTEFVMLDWTHEESLSVNIEANFDYKGLIIVLTTYENVLNSVLPCPTETLLDILKPGLFAAGTVHSSLQKTRKKKGITFFSD